MAPGGVGGGGVGSIWARTSALRASTSACTAHRRRHPTGLWSDHRPQGLAVGRSPHRARRVGQMMFCLDETPPPGMRIPPRCKYQSGIGDRGKKAPCRLVPTCAGFPYCRAFAAGNNIRRENKPNSHYNTCTSIVERLRSFGEICGLMPAGCYAGGWESCTRPYRQLLAADVCSAFEAGECPRPTGKP